jgi:hypothetical protein
MYSSSSISWPSYRHQVSSSLSVSSPDTSGTWPPWPEKVRKKKSPLTSAFEAARKADSSLARVPSLVSSTVAFMPRPVASAAMSLASNSQAASGPVQPA